MKPNFALSLSFDGIQLLHRAAGGWREVGAVPLATDDLAGELAVLRKTASSLGSAGVRTKLLIPNEQIKYMTIQTPGMAKRDRREAAAAALEGATPYPVAQLAFDISIDGPQTHVAAVARETLREAESFALEHRFNPVSFVASPGDEAYLGEPFFGRTKAAPTFLEDGDEIEPDGIAVVVVGPASAPAEDPKHETGSDPAPDPGASGAAAPVPAAGMSARPGTASPQATQMIRESDAIPDPDSNPEPGSAPVEGPPAPPGAETEEATSLPDVAAKVTAPDIPSRSTDAEDAVDAAPQESETDATSTVSAGFATRRSGGPERSPVLSGVRRDPAPTHSHLTPDSSSLDHRPPSPGLEAKPSANSAPVASKSVLSRRKAPPAVAPAASVTAPTSEAARMTIFGAREPQVGGKPRFLGLILTAFLLMFLVGVAAWAAVFLDDGIASLLGGREPRATASAPENLDSPEIIIEEADEDGGLQTAALDADLTSEDTAVLDALAEPQGPPVITAQEAEARYAVTGIWPLSPDAPDDAPQTIPASDVYLPTLDTSGGSTDAIALPGVSGYETDEAMPRIASPPPAGTSYALDARGMLIPTPEGTVSSDGYVLFLDSPPLKPPYRPSAEGEAATPVETALVELAGFRPRIRPEGFGEAIERARTGGLILEELAAYRPSLRPNSLRDNSDEARAREGDAARAADLAVQSANLALQNPPSAEDVADPVRAAVVASRRPDARPGNFERIVRRAEPAEPAQQPAQQEVRTASAAPVAPRTVAPSIPSSASVSQQATVTNAINLRKVNLIGIYGKPSSRRALIRLGDGRYQKVVVGDQIDGGRVSAISDDKLLYRKGRRDIVLSMPQG